LPWYAFVYCPSGAKTLTGLAAVQLDDQGRITRLTGLFDQP
jgi:hypothetical protein